MGLLDSFSYRVLPNLSLPFSKILKTNSLIFIISLRNKRPHFRHSRDNYDNDKFYSNTLKKHICILEQVLII